MTLSVNSSGERGLLGVAFDPNFASNQFIYVFYTATTPAVHNRISRFKANGDVVDTSVAEVVLLDFDNLSGAMHFGLGGEALRGARRQCERKQLADSRQPARQGHPDESRTGFDGSDPG
jgi:uncharacterized membrane protein